MSLSMYGLILILSKIVLIDFQYVLKFIYFNQSKVTYQFYFAKVEKIRFMKIQAKIYPMSTAWDLGVGS